MSTPRKQHVDMLRPQLERSLLRRDKAVFHRVRHSNDGIEPDDSRSSLERVCCTHQRVNHFRRGRGFLERHQACRENVAVWLSASMRKSSIKREAAQIAAHGLRAPKRGEDTLFVEQADASSIPGQDSLTEAHGRVDQGRGNAAPFGYEVFAERPQRRSAAKTQFSACSASRSTTSQDGVNAARNTQQTVQRDTELDLALADSRCRPVLNWNGAEFDARAEADVTSATVCVRNASHSSPSRKINTLTDSTCARAR